jgi:hypothetical protein
LNLSATSPNWEMFGHHKVHILYFWNSIKGNHLEKNRIKKKVIVAGPLLQCSSVPKSSHQAHGAETDRARMPSTFPTVAPTGPPPPLVPDGHCPIFTSRPTCAHIRRCPFEHLHSHPARSPLLATLLCPVMHRHASRPLGRPSCVPVLPPSKCSNCEASR